MCINDMKLAFSASNCAGDKCSRQTVGVMMLFRGMNNFKTVTI